MSNCIKNCKLCDRLILSQSITFENDTLVVNLPANSYENRKKYCIVLAQSIPDAATINAPVVFTIGSNSTTYPFVNYDCSSIYASQIRTRRKYPVIVNTSVNSGVFKYAGECKLPSNSTTINRSIPVEGASA